LSEKLWYKVARNIVKAGAFPFPITDTLFEFLKTIITEEQAEFLLMFTNPSMTLEQIKKKVKDKANVDESSIKKMLNDLMDNGIITGTISRSTGEKVYRLMGPFPGIFEYTLMRGKTDEKHKRFAKLAEKLFSELSEKAQKNYESISVLYKQALAIDRTIPVEKEIQVGTESVMPYEALEPYFKEYGAKENRNGIALIHCYCRHEKDLLNDPCKLNAPKLNCFLLDKSAQFAIEHKFGVPISAEEALRLCKEAEDYGLVHKVFHVHSDPKLGLEAMCNCCKCCCGIFQLYQRGVMPYHTISSYLANINQELCVGCGTCVQKCPIEAIELSETIANVEENKCLGCGICAHFCPENAIHLKRTGPRDVFVPLKKINN
jgi:ferredoxin